MQTNDYLTIAFYEENLYPINYPFLVRFLQKEDKSIFRKVLSRK